MSVLGLQTRKRLASHRCLAIHPDEGTYGRGYQPTPGRTQYSKPLEKDDQSETQDQRVPAYDVFKTK